MIRTVDAVARPGVGARVQRRGMPGAVKVRLYGFGGLQRGGARYRAHLGLDRRIAGANRLHADRLNDEPPLAHEEGKALAIG